MKVRLAVAPTCRGDFARESAPPNKERIFKKLSEMGVELSSLDGVLPDGLLGFPNEVDRAAKALLAGEPDALFLPHCNFGDERSCALLARALGKPVLLWGPKDPAPSPDGLRAGDVQCGLFATSKALLRLGVPFSYIPNCPVDSAEFDRGVREFLAAAGAARCFLGARVGQLSTRPGPFWTTMYNEAELLENWGVEVIPRDLGTFAREVLVRAQAPDERVRSTAKELESLAEGVSPELVSRIAALAHALRDWVEAEKLDALAVQCWTAMEELLGVWPCYAMGLVTDWGVPAVCETDVNGALTSLLLRGASGGAPVFFADLTNRHPGDDRAELLWHCGVFPPSLAKGKACLGVHYASSKDEPGTGEFEIEGGNVTVARFDGLRGDYSLLFGELEGTAGPYTRGSYLWARARSWRRWEEKVIRGPYVHHVSCVHGSFAKALYEACRFIPGLRPDPVEPTREELDPTL